MISVVVLSSTLYKSSLKAGRQAKLLTLPGEMGERFKVLALERNYPAVLSGFALRDLSASL